jgi:hypothetical protein
MLFWVAAMFSLLRGVLHFGLAGLFCPALFQGFFMKGEKAAQKGRR